MVSCMHCKTCILKICSVHISKCHFGRMMLRLALIGRLVHFKLGSVADTKKFSSENQVWMCFVITDANFPYGLSHTMKNL